MGEHSAVTQLDLTSARLQLARLPVEPIGKVLRQACKISGRALDITRVGVWLFRPEDDLLECVCLYSTNDAPVPAPLRMSKMPTYVAAVREQRFVATSNAQLDLHTLELNEVYLKPLGITSMLDSAIYRSGEVVGVVCHERVGEPRDFSESEREFAATVADIVAYLLEADRRGQLERQVHALEVRLKDAQRIEAVSRFAAGIAHDLGNLLSVVTTGLEVLDRQGQGGDVLTMLREAASHGSALTRQLSSLTRGGRTDRDRQLLRGRELEQRWKTLLGSMLQEPWAVAFDVDPEAQLWADSLQLEQVLLNLVFNARDAMAGGGTILVRLKAHDGRTSRLEVVDTGEGISPEQVGDVFTPYFSTRGGRGAGLGLSTVQFLVHEHGGRVELSSAVGDGTTVTVHWPKAAPA